VLTKKQYHYQNQRFNIISDTFLCSSQERKFDGKEVNFSGAYPAGFLKDVKLAFKAVYPKNTKKILHVCSGRISPQEGDRLDIDPTYKPDYVDNAETMSKVPSNKYLWVQSDTPYNERSSEKYYGRPLLNRSKMIKAMTRVCKVNGFVALLDQISPNSTPRNLKRVALIFVTSIPNQDARIFTVFQKMKNKRK
jgi:hypothetical protein